MNQVPLHTLIQNIQIIETHGSLHVNVLGITSNSKKVLSNFAFVAVRGLTVDGHKFIDKAIAAGAIVVIGQKPFLEIEASSISKVTYVQVTNSKEDLGVLCSNFYDNPSDKLKIIGVTGTDGKTTTSHLIFSILKASGFKTGMISTLGAYIESEKIETGLHVTSPDAEDVQYLLSQMRLNGVTHAVLEVTSHSIDQDRFSGVHFDVSVITNITHEHLDYHKTFENYRDTKLRLFLTSEYSILNMDDPSFNYFKGKLFNKNVYTYSKLRIADYYSTNIVNDGTMSFTLNTSLTKEHVSTNLVGEFNISNCLAAASATLSIGCRISTVVNALSVFISPEGRMELIPNNIGLKIVVDFAHTPNALLNLLKTLKSELLNGHKLIVVFGCAGERDNSKRKLMGNVAGEIADISVVTTEDPRHESVDLISREIISGIKEKKGEYKRIDDRGDAIFQAINVIAISGDIVVVSGKGHEKSMSFDGIEYEWSDKKAIKEALSQKVLKLKPLN